MRFVVESEMDVRKPRRRGHQITCTCGDQMPLTKDVLVSYRQFELHLIDAHHRLDAVTRALDTAPI